jgi:hypothetical protein
MRAPALAITFACLLAVAAMCGASGLDDPRDIDIVRVVAGSKQVHLYLVLDPEQRPEDRTTSDKVRRKLDAYRFYVTSGQVWLNEKGANPKLPVVLTVVVTGPMTPATRAALEALRSTYDVSATSYAFVHNPSEATKR